MKKTIRPKDESGVGGRKKRPPDIFKKGKREGSSVEDGRGKRRYYTSGNPIIIGGKKRTLGRGEQQRKGSLAVRLTV